MDRIEIGPLTVHNDEDRAAGAHCATTAVGLFLASAAIVVSALYFGVQLVIAAVR